MWKDLCDAKGDIEQLLQAKDNKTSFMSDYRDLHNNNSWHFKLRNASDTFKGCFLYESLDKRHARLLCIANSVA